VDKRNGIILKTLFSKKMKMIVLDDHLGKIEAVPPSDKYITGSLISYYAQMRGQIYFLHTIELLDMPLALAKDDILFFHHVLEIVYFSTPFSSSVPEIYGLVQQLYGPYYGPHTNEFKIVFLFKLLVALGMHPEETRFHDPNYYLLARESIDTIINKSIHLDIKRALHEWVRACVLVHPLVHVFKTMHFLDTK
jgi:hypothetical protein